MIDDDDDDDDDDDECGAVGGISGEIGESLHGLVLASTAILRDLIWVRNRTTTFG
jgi:hypothetical protein